MPERSRLTKGSPITLVELPATSGGRLNGEAVVDVYSRLHLPPRAIFGLQPFVERAGYRDVVSIAPQYNPNSKLTDRDLRRIFNSDVLAISSITRTITQSEELARKYKEINPKGYVIAGGPHVTALAEESLEWADTIVRGEGEETLQELMATLEDNGSTKGVKGVSYKEGDTVVHEPLRDLLSEEKFANLPLPYYSEVVRKGIKVHTAVTSRGCPHDCSYCIVPIINGNCYRRKSNEVNLAHLEVLPKGVTFIIDDNFAGRPKETKELLLLMEERGLNVNSYIAQLRAQAGFIKDFPQLLWRAGVRLACVGIESFSDETLSQIGKKTTAEQNKEGVRLLREAGVHVHGMLMAGLDGDTPESLRETLEYVKDECDTIQVFAPGPVAGTQFAREMEEQGRILTKEPYLYDGQYVVVRPKNFSPSGLQQTILDFYKEFYSFKLSGDRVKKAIFGWTSGINRSSRSSTYQKLRELKYDFVTRAFAWSAIRAFTNDPQTRSHFKNLKAWS